MTILKPPAGHCRCECFDSQRNDKVHLLVTAAYPWSGTQGVLEPILADIRREAGIHPGQVASPSQGTHTIHSHTHTQRQFRVYNQPDVRVFGLQCNRQL